ncbi:MAG: STAS domain-containing protein [Nitriliruptorales bacterium]|nr:STAS domain-containing protein [Nitriliruptorales bacterium]
MDVSRFSVERRGNESRVELLVSGELDAHTAPQLEAHLQPGDSSPAIVLDLTDVEFIDSSGLGVIVAAHNSPDVGSLKVRGLSDRVRKVFEYAGLHEHLDIE